MKTIQYQNWSTDIFDGFYESNLYNSDSVYNMTYGQPKPPVDYYYDIYDYDGFQIEVGKYAVACLWSDGVPIGDEVILGMRFTGISSPRFYNYGTDRLEMEVDVDYDKLKEFCLKTKRIEFDKYLSDNFSDRSGFWSFVANNVIGFENELEEESERYDQVMLEFYLLGLDYLKEKDHDFSDYKRDLYEYSNEKLWGRLCLYNEKDKKFYDFREDRNGECIVGEEIRNVCS